MLVSPFDQDRHDLRAILRHSGCRLHDVATWGEAVKFLKRHSAPVAICESQLPDGTWKDLLRHLSLMDHPPALVVASRVADESLWSEVLHLGGYNVLSKPLDPEEVMRVVDHACPLWDSVPRERSHFTRIA